MTKRTKKFFAGLLAGVMVISTVVPGFAATTEIVDTFSKTASVNGVSETYEAKINITVPTSVETLINPYAINVDDSTGVADILTTLGITDKESVSSASIISPKYEIINKSEVPVTVSIRDFKVSGNGIKIAGSSVAGKNDVKSAYIYLQLAKKSGEKYIGQSQKVVDPIKTTEKKVAYTNNTEYKSALKKEIWEVKPKDAKKIAAGKEGSALKEPFSIGVNDSAFLRIMGDVNSNPAAADANGKKIKDQYDPWTNADKLDISYKLVFTGKANPTNK